jgi:hypothetical protein
MASLVPQEIRADPLLVQSDTKVTPVLTVAERYDSNVYFLPGKRLDDYVTTVMPQLRIDHFGRLLSGSLTVMATGEAYAKNPGLNYIAPSGSLSMDLDNLIGKLDRRAKLKIMDTFMFTPKPLAFIGPTVGSEVPDTFVRGIQASRANSRSNMAMANGAYLLTSTMSLQGSYTYSTMRFGTVFIPPAEVQATQGSGASFFSTTYQSYSIGPQFQVTPLDIVTINYQGSQADYNRGDSLSSFKTQGGTLGWKRMLTARLTADGYVGLTLIGSGANATTTYVANAGLEWQQDNGIAMLRYSRSVFPSFFVVPVPLLSQVITLSETFRATGNLSLTGSVSYAKNESTSGQVPLSFESYSISFLSSYTINRFLTAIASYTHSNFNQSFNGAEFAFNRNLVSLSLRGEWN